MSKWEEDNNSEKVIFILGFLIIGIMVAVGVLIYYENIKLNF